MALRISAEEKNVRKLQSNNKKHKTHILAFTANKFDQCCKVALEYKTFSNLTKNINYYISTETVEIHRYFQK